MIFLNRDILLVVYVNPVTENAFVNEKGLLHLAQNKNTRIIKKEI